MGIFWKYVLVSTTTNLAITICYRSCPQLICGAIYHELLQLGANFGYPAFLDSHSDFTNIEFDSYIIPTNELSIDSFRLLDVDNRVILPINSEKQVKTSKNGKCYQFRGRISVFSYHSIFPFLQFLKKTYVCFLSVRVLRILIRLLVYIKNFPFLMHSYTRMFMLDTCSAPFNFT